MRVNPDGWREASPRDDYEVRLGRRVRVAVGPMAGWVGVVDEVRPIGPMVAASRQVRVDFGESIHSAYAHCALADLVPLED